MKQFARNIIFFLIFTASIASQITFPSHSTANTNLIVYSYDRPLQLYAFLESVEHYVTGIDRIFVIYRTSNSEYQKAYETVQSVFKKATFLAQSFPSNDLKKITCECLLESLQPYILFGVDDIIVKDFIDLNECTQALEKHNAHGFFFRLGKNLDYCYAMGQPQPLPPLKDLESSIYSWQFNQGMYDWNYPHNLDCTLYRLSDLIELVFLVDFSTPNSLESQLMRHVDCTKTGLCYETSKIVNFPLNMVQNECPNNCQNSYSPHQLLELFNKGLKIDIKPLDRLINKSAHAQCDNLITFIARQPLEEKLIIIVTPSYNNKEWWEWNLKSLLDQNYDNYQIIITDDCSTDGTGDAIANYVTTHHLESKITVIKNTQRRGALHNLYNMIHSCPDNAIVVAVDGDDALHDPEVLNRLNHIYSTQDVWLTYGQFIEHPSGNKGWCTPIPNHVVHNNAFRDHPDLPSHLRTFYAWLFKSIKLEDMLYQGNFYQMTWDYVMMFPMIEMAGPHHLCIQDDILYIYNNSNTISDHKISRQLQAHLAQVVRAKQRYHRLPFVTNVQNNHMEQEKADIIIFAEECDPEVLNISLSSFMENVRNYDTIYAIYLYWPTTIARINQLKEQYPSVVFLEIEENRTNFKDLITKLYTQTLKNNYVVFALPNTKVIHPIDLNQCIQELEEHHAYSFSLKLSKENCCKAVPDHLPLLELKDDVCAWDYASANNIWSCANNVDMSLYRRNNSHLIHILQNYWMYTWVHIVGWWAHEGNLNKVGLCYKYPKIVEL